MAGLLRTGDYERRGDYHRHIDRNWIYYPVYVEKMRRVRAFVDRCRYKKILDVGCGEGVLVEDLRAQGFDITGLDLNYRSNYVQQGDILACQFPSNTFDVLLCLDMLEHLSFCDQEKAILEMHRLLKSGGILYATIPNLAHLASRLSFLVRGRLIRTSDVHRHIGDRPMGEYREILSTHFKIERISGIFPSFPLLSVLTRWIPSKVVWLHRIYNSALAWPGICFLNIYECRKE